MSKSLGNVIDPYKVVEEYGVDALRYYLAREVSPFEDSDFTMEKFKEVYNANLANGIGNLTSRIMRMATANAIVLDDATSAKIAETDTAKNLHQKQTAGFENYNIKDVADAVWEVISFVDKLIQTTEPFKTIKTDKVKGEEEIRGLVAYLDLIATALLPILPDTAAEIAYCVKNSKMPESPLFVRMDIYCDKFYFFYTENSVFIE